MDTGYDLAALAERKWKLRDFEIGERLFKGYASKVYVALDKRAKKYGGRRSTNVVFKVYNQRKLSALTEHQIEREIRIQSSLQHENILPILGTFTHDKFKTVVLPYAEDQSLWHALPWLMEMRRSRYGDFVEHIVNNVIKPTLSALAYMHDRGIAHRDIKPENLFMCGGSLLVADFGLAIETLDEPAVTKAGTPCYMAPEVWKCEPKRLPWDNKEREDLQYTTKVDVWAVGVMVYELLSGLQFVMLDHPHRFPDRIMQFHDKSWKFDDVNCKLASDWLRKALHPDPKDRATVRELMQHPWMSQGSARDVEELKVQSASSDGSSMSSSTGQTDVVGA